MLKNKLFFSLVFIFCSSAFLVAQNQQIAGAIHTQYTINSQILNEERTILVRVPANYNRTNENFPVLYMLDAHPPQNTMMSGIVEQQSWGGTMPEMIVVGI